jgi:hypothetical protein
MQAERNARDPLNEQPIGIVSFGVSADTEPISGLLILDLALSAAIEGP